MDMTAVPAGFEEIRREELARTFRRLLRVRTFLQPLLLLILLYIVVSDPSWIRALAVLAVAATVSLASASSTAAAVSPRKWPSAPSSPE